PTFLPGSEAARVSTSRPGPRRASTSACRILRRAARRYCSWRYRTDEGRRQKGGSPMITTLLIIHALLAVALLGAIPHQAASVWLPARRPAGSFVGRFRSVAAASYANAI